MKNPAFFRGARFRSRYFEGWYFKCISADRKHAIALIPGIAISPEQGRHAFIQMINAVSGQTWYFRYPYNSFGASKDQLYIQIGDNLFHQQGLTLNIQSQNDRQSAQTNKFSQLHHKHTPAEDKTSAQSKLDENQPDQSVANRSSALDKLGELQTDHQQSPLRHTLSGNLKFSNIQVFPSNRLNPGIMGPFDFVPFMECYHAIVHLSHDISGQLTMDGQVMNFDGGVGYIEKDYGTSFPKTYVWLQAGHFDASDQPASFVFSRARIPFLGTEFTGFFAYLSDGKGLSVRFATYNHSKLTSWQVDLENKTCSGVLTGPQGCLTFSARMSGGGVLRAPVDGIMDREIIESITAVVAVKLENKQGNVLFDSESHEAGMEICI